MPPSPGVLRCTPQRCVNVGGPSTPRSAASSMRRRCPPSSASSLRYTTTCSMPLENMFQHPKNLRRQVNACSMAKPSMAVNSWTRPGNYAAAHGQATLDTPGMATLERGSSPAEPTMSILRGTFKSDPVEPCIGVAMLLCASFSGAGDKKVSAARLAFLGRLIHCLSGTGQKQQEPAPKVWTHTFHKFAAFSWRMYEGRVNRPANPNPSCHMVGDFVQYLCCSEQISTTNSSCVRSTGAEKLSEICSSSRIRDVAPARRKHVGGR